MKRLFNLLIRVMAFFIIIAIIVNIYHQYHLYAIEREEYDYLTQRVLEEQERQAQILYELEHHLSDEYVEQVARNQLGLVRSTEILFVNIYQ